MARRHFLVVDTATGFVAADWETEASEDVLPTPDPGPGREMVDVTAQRLKVGARTGQVRQKTGEFRKLTPDDEAAVVASTAAAVEVAEIKEAAAAEARRKTKR